MNKTMISQPLPLKEIPDESELRRLNEKYAKLTVKERVEELYRDFDQ